MENALIFKAVKQALKAAGTKYIDRKFKVNIEIHFH